MRIEQLQVVLRPRNPWEAMEMGTALIRQHAGLIWRSWLLFTLPVLLLTLLLMWLTGVTWTGWLLLWWLKPWFDRIPLFVLSRVVFGEQPTLRQCLAAPFRFGRTSLLGDLTLRRLSLHRSLLLPVSCLEGLSGASMRRRRQLLATSDSKASQLTILALHFEVLLNLGLIMLIGLFIPSDYLETASRQLLQWLRQADFLASAVTQTSYWLAMSVLEPFYVGAGFGLYLNRRTLLEAWDIELVFRKLAARIQSQRHILMAITGSALLWLVLAGSPMGQQAQATPAPTRTATTAPDATAKPATPPSEPVFQPQQVTGLPPDTRFGQAVDHAYQDPLLRSTTIRSSWEPVKQDQNKKNEKASLPEWLRWLLGMDHDGKTASATSAEQVGTGLKWLLISLAGVLLALAGWWAYRHRHLLAIGPPGKKTAAATVTDLPATAGLPASWHSLIDQYWQAGRYRDASALLYQAAVSRLSQQSGQPIAADATEADCLAITGQLADAQQPLYRDIILLWQRVAYAGQPPDSGHFHALLHALSGNAEQAA